MTSSTLSLQKQFHTGSRDRSGFVAKILLLKIHLPVSPTFFLQTVHLFRFGVFCFSSNAGGSGPVTSVLPVASFSDTSREVATVRGKEEFTH